MASKRISLKGKGADLFFGDFASEGAELSPLAAEGDAGDADATIIRDTVAPVEAEPWDTASPSPEAPPRPETGAAEKAGKHASRRASTLAIQTDKVESIRRVVKRPGKEVVYVRLTPEEKEQLADVVYTYKRRGIRTSDNELGRIAINGLLVDHRERGEESLLAMVLAALEA